VFAQKPPVQNSNLNAVLMYQTALWANSVFSLATQAPALPYCLDAARKTKEERLLLQRATESALQSRSGASSVFSLPRPGNPSLPDSQEANRYTLANSRWPSIASKKPDAHSRPALPNYL
jgi:hypothetical protein